MPFDPHEIVEPLPDWHIGASLDDPQLSELTDEALAAREGGGEPAASPEPPAAPSEPEPAQQEQVSRPGHLADPAELWRAVQDTDSDLIYDDVEDAGWGADEAQAAQEAFEELQDLADEDPLAAIDYLSQLYSSQREAQVRADVEQELAPMRSREYQAEAADVVGQLQAEFGVEAVEANKERLAEMVTGNASSFLYGGVDENGVPVPLEAAGRHARLREALMAAEYERQTAYARGDDIVDAMSEHPVRRDTFGQLAATRPQRAASPSPPTPQPAAAPQASAQPPNGGVGQVFVEGGSSPAPSSVRSRPLSPDERIIAEMDDLSPGSDTFGRIFR